MNPFEFIKSIIVDGFELFFCLFFVLFDFFLEFLVLLLKLRYFLELKLEGFKLFLMEGVDLGDFVV